MTPQSKNTPVGAAQSIRAERRSRTVIRNNERRSEATLFRDDFDRDVWCLLGIPVDVTDINGAVGTIDSAIRIGEPLSFVTPNVNWLVRATRNPVARREILNANLSLVDGAPLVKLARFLGVPVTSRVAGSDVFEALHRRPDFVGRKIRVFFFGGRDGAAETAVERLNAAGGGVEAVGALNPGFGDVDSMSTPATLGAINDAEPDFIVVALGAAKGQAWIDANREKLNAPVIAHLGAVVDFAAGSIKRAPKAFQKVGLEWLWRIKEEPSLWKRYFDDGKALLAILFSGVLPQLGRRPNGADSKSDVGLVEYAEQAVIKLSGCFRKDNLAEIRKVFRQAASLQTDVILDFSDVSEFDLSFLGLVLMLEKASSANKCELSVRGIAKSHRKVLKANNMNYRDFDKIEHQEMSPSLAAAS
ncbi:MAG: WecB/TagA/CpsF family glycosyltransferase [Marinicaulis sp.]|nr:WecB/TagA/CpsF family glycosyltransferase [Marinicaulis sp.]